MSSLSLNCLSFLESNLLSIMCRPRFSVFLVFLWDYLMYSQAITLYLVSGNYMYSEVAAAPWNKYGVTIMVCIALFFPFFGLLADVWIGRYKAILVGMVLCFLSWTSGGNGFIFYQNYGYTTIFWIFCVVSSALQVSGYSSFRANIVQYNIDQLVGASADELSTIIYWHSAVVPVIELLFFLFQCTFEEVIYLFLAMYITSGLSVSLVLVSYSFFKHKLENISLIKNPIKLIVRVLCYARKHKYPENRSALTYWEEEAPSRLDLGKEKYGGPFTEEEVEDVKTFFRIVFLLIISVCAYAYTDNRDWSVYGNVSLTSCLIVTRFPFNLSCLILNLLFLCFFRVCFYKYIPSMLSRMGLGLFFAFTVTIARLAIFAFFERYEMQYDMIVPQLLHSLSYIYYCLQYHWSLQ